MPGGLTWGLNNDDAGMPSGWGKDLLDFKKYGGPSTSFRGGRLPPRMKDLIVHYYYLLGLNPNYHARTIPEENKYVDKVCLGSWLLSLHKVLFKYYICILWG